MFHVVYLRPPQDRAHFGSLVDSLNQGASFEGIYNGLTHSSDYRKLEVANPGSSARALQVFSESLAELSLELPAETDFGAGAAKPLALPVQPGSPSGVDEIDFTKKKPAPGVSSEPATLTMRKAAYLAKFQDASVFTLKRVLGDEALKVLDHYKKDRAALAGWYGKWVVRMVRHGVDFGLSSRNVADEKLHAEWAASAEPDRLIWEVLNRLHRVVNEAQRKP